MPGFVVTPKNELNVDFELSGKILRQTIGLQIHPLIKTFELRRKKIVHGWGFIRCILALDVN